MDKSRDSIETIGAFIGDRIRFLERALVTAEASDRMRVYSLAELRQLYGWGVGDIEERLEDGALQEVGVVLGGKLKVFYIDPRYKLIRRSSGNGDKGEV